MMDSWCAVIFLSSGYPLWLAWRANRQTALVHALAWGVAAWVAWLWAMMVAIEGPESDTGALRYLALCLTGCAMVAVLGARQPGAAAWHLVVGGLLAVLLLPLAEHWLARSRLGLAWFRVVLVGGVLAVGVLNYLPTRLGPAALVLALGTTLEILRLINSEALVQGSEKFAPLGCLMLALTPWVAFAFIRRRGTEVSEFDRVWHGFRDRFGLVWGQRLREQFNRSAAHAGWPVHLTWQGLHRLPRTASGEPSPEAALLAALQALMKRFASASEARRSETGS
jgi:hypothetical protein